MVHSPDCQLRGVLQFGFICRVIKVVLELLGFFFFVFFIN